MEHHHKNLHKGLFTKKIAEYHIPRVFAKLPKLETYDSTTDPNEHTEHLNTVLDYHLVRGTMKCKLSVLTLKDASMTWFNGLGYGSIG
jgi:hypothetical protein